MKAMFHLMDGKKVSQEIKNKIRMQVEALNKQNINVCLAVVLVGSDPASQIYVSNKKKTCQALSIESKEYLLPENTTQKQLIDLIRKLNADSQINGVLVQLPLPKHINSDQVIHAIDPQKDVDAFHPINVGKLMLGQCDFMPCTPAGILELLRYYHVDLSGKHCVVLGRSNIVGKPLSMLFLHQNATVTVCHSHTQHIEEIARSADILVSAVGKANFVTSSMVSDGAVVVDVGINRMENGKLLGDVDFQQVAPKASLITPVPGGVGPMTIAMLMANVVRAAELQNR